MSETDCGDILLEIEAFVDGEMKSLRYEQIEIHLGLCSPCLERADFRQRLKALISGKCCADSVPEALADRIRSLIAAEG